MNKFYFKTEIMVIPIALCMVKIDGTRIGSTGCQCCEFCNKRGIRDEFGDVRWIECSRIKEATGELPRESSRVFKSKRE